MFGFTRSIAVPASHVLAYLGCAMMSLLAGLYFQSGDVMVMSSDKLSAVVLISFVLLGLVAWVRRFERRGGLQMPNGNRNKPMVLLYGIIHFVAAVLPVTLVCMSDYQHEASFFYWLTIFVLLAVYMGGFTRLKPEQAHPSQVVIEGEVAAAT